LPPVCSCWPPDAHFRSDFPQRNDADFLGSFHLARAADSYEPLVTFVPAP
jgi:succinate dehydrogenase/fumarate reductase flavoprotein subunit